MERAPFGFRSRCFWADGMNDLQEDATMVQRHTQTIYEDGIAVRDVGLARAGTDFSNLAYSHSPVAGLRATPLSVHCCW